MTDQPEETGGFQFITPSEILAHQRRIVDHHAMAMMEFRQSVDRLVDELSPEQCFTLFRLLQNISTNGTSVAEFFSGQLSIMLRRIHKLCQSCGNTEHTSDEHAFLAMGEEAAEELRSQGIRPETVNQDDLSQVPDEDLTEFDMLVKYDVERITRQGRTYVVCHQCDQEYPSIEDRAKQGVTCPGCEARELFDGKTD